MATVRIKRIGGSFSLEKPHESLMEKWQDLCQESFGAYLLTVGGLTGIGLLAGLLFL